MRANGLGFRERCPALFAALVVPKRARTKVALVLSLGRLANDIYVSAFEAILFVETTIGTQLRDYAIRISKDAAETVPSLRVLEEKYGISRRTLERTGAKLARVGLIECVSPLSKRSDGQHGWRLSSRMGAALRQLADKIDAWKSDTRPERRGKDERLVGMLR